MNMSTIRLFKAVPITAKKRKKASALMIKATLQKGFVFAPEVIANYNPNELHEILKLVEQELGLTAEQMNKTFHKSWHKIKTAHLAQLVMEQLIHYFTTYGFRQLGIDSPESIYIPNETLDIPDINMPEGGFNIIIINGYTKKELKEKILNMLQSGIALSEDSIKDVVEVCKFVELTGKEIDTIKNREVKVSLYDELKLVPENPVEFLRYVIYKAINKTLLIKDRATIEAIKEAEDENLKISKLFHKYNKEYGLKGLASIFYRFKPLFLAFKTNDDLRFYANKIGKLAVTCHKPMPVDYLNEVTSTIKKGGKIKVTELNKELDKVNTFRKIRLAYALKYRTKSTDSILYKVRNGKSYATDFDFFDKWSVTNDILKVVVNSIIKDIKLNVKGKKIYIPENIHYTLPATEKQFTGNMPSGSYVTVPKDIVFGVHWNNVNHNQIDLDLSLMSPTTGKIGWDGNYRNEDRSILFSGDITDAPDGATELFYVRRQKLDAFILFVNYFNFNSEVEVPFKILVAQEQVSNLRKNYMVNPNNVKAVAKTKINQKQMILGLLVTTTKECRFYFTESYIGQAISSSGKPYVENARKYLFEFYRNTISLNEVLETAGAKLITDKEKCDINLSIEALEKDTIINLITK